MTATSESPSSTGHRLELSGQQRTLHDVLSHKDGALAVIYLGALYVFDQKHNPDYLALAAHGVREFIEKLPKIAGITPQRPDISNKCAQLASKWDKSALKSDCYSGEVFSGEIDDKLHRFLDSAKVFFEWFRVRPSRRDERTDTIRSFDMGQFKMPDAIENIRTNELEVYAKYFTGVSHHGFITSDEVFSSHLIQFENFVLDFLCPRTFDDHEEIDALILAGEKDAK